MHKTSGILMSKIIKIQCFFSTKTFICIIQLYCHFSWITIGIPDSIASLLFSALLLMIKIGRNVSGKKNICVVWFLWLTNIYLISSSIRIFDLVNIFLCFFKILPLCPHRKQHSENMTSKIFWGLFEGGEKLFSFLTGPFLGLMLFRDNVDRINHITNLVVQDVFKMLFNIH